MSNFGSPRNSVKHIFLESSYQELFENTIFIGFGQTFQKLCQYKSNSTTFWHRLLLNMVISRDSGRQLVLLVFAVLSAIKF